MHVRVGEAPDDLGDWMPIEPGRSLTVKARGPVYLQYRLILSAIDSSVAPIVLELAFEWTSELASPRSPSRRVHP